ncbi:MAG: response regulator transcription factor [Bacteroidota bacterium]|nr:MAG: response regulator transcription factor [Bacteroidota bacterium]
MNEILIVEDHPLVAEGLQKLLADNGICVSCPVASSGAECIEILKNYIPSVVFLDINLPDINGIDLCKQILKMHPAIKVLALSSFGSRSFIEKIVENGASGYLVKNSDSEEIMAAIAAVKQGNKYFCKTSQQVLSSKTDGGLPVLTRREVEVMRYISDGLTNNEIAEQMFISPLTVDSHRKNLLTKLGAKNTASLVKIAMLHDLI